jgi:hypothetical protein
MGVSAALIGRGMLDLDRERRGVPNRIMSEPKVSDSRSNIAEYSVSEISNALKRTVEDAFGTRVEPAITLLRYDLQVGYEPPTGPSR